MSYARQKTCQAVSCLIGTRPIRDRLVDAGTLLVMLRSSLHPQERELAAALRAIIDVLTSGETEDLESGAAKLSDDEARKAASDILSLMVTAFGGV